MVNILNTELFSSMVRNKRGDKGLRLLAEEIGDVSPATLSRIEQGKIPDVETFIKICTWLGVSADSFIVSKDETPHASRQDLIIAHLRSESELDSDTVGMIVKLVNLAYSKKI